MKPRKNKNRILKIVSSITKEVFYVIKVDGSKMSKEDAEEVFNLLKNNEFYTNKKYISKYMGYMP